MSDKPTVIAAPFKQHHLGDFANELKAFIYEKAASQNIAAVIGVIEIVKLEILDEAGANRT